MVIEKSDSYKICKKEEVEKLVICKFIDCSIKDMSKNIYDVVVHDNSRVTLVKLLDPSATVSTINIEIKNNSTLDLNILDLTMNKEYIINVSVQNNSKFNLISKVYLDSDISNKYKINLEHVGNNSKSNINVTSILNDTSEYNNEIYVDVMNNCKYNEVVEKVKVITLSNNTKSKVTPALKILNNEIVGSHGYTISKISDQDMYFLNSRGIKKRDAEKLIVMSNINNGSLYDACMIERRLNEKRKFI